MATQQIPLQSIELFAGAGGGILAGHLHGWRTVCAVEWDAYAASVLVQRQNDGCLPPFPVWDDVQTFDGRMWRGRVDVISGGFPCQDISAAGKGAGIDGERSGMWGHMARIVGEVRPRNVFVENSPMLVGRGLARVLGDLASLGYDARWGIVGAHHTGAPHRRDRMWILADSCGARLQGKQQPGALHSKGNRAQAHGSVAERSSIPGPLEPCAFCGYEFSYDALGRYGCPNCFGEGFDDVSDSDGEGWEERSWWPTESDLGRGLPDGLASRVDINGTDAQGGISRVGKGIPHRVDRLKCIGNGQVPQCAALAWQILHSKLNDEQLK